MKTRFAAVLLPALIAMAYAGTAAAQIKVGVTLSATGPAASLGIPEKNTFPLLPKTIAGQTVEYIVLDDASDSTTAVKNARKLISEDKVDVLIGSTVTPNSLAMIDVAAESETPMISMAASAAIVEPQDAKRRWVFKTPQNDSHMTTAILSHMADNGVKTIGFIGFADAYGEGWYREVSKLADIRKIKMVVNERFARADTSVTGQILKILAANNDFLRVCGKDCEGTWLPSGPILVADQLPDSNPVKKSALAYKSAYEKAYGAGSVSTFGGHAWDAGALMANAVPTALKAGKPGTPEFRKGMRDALENTKELAGAHGIFNMSATDHLGFDQRSRVMVQIVDGKWKLGGDAK